MEEIWKDIEGYEGLYQVSNLGRVKSLNYKRTKKEKIMKPTKNSNDYLYVGLSKNNKSKLYRIHRLVAQAFIDNPNNYKEINHKDENKTNNNIENLEWCTQKYNINYGTRTLKASKHLSKIIYCLEIDKYYKSIRQASRELNIDQSYLSKILKRNLKHINGLTFFYANKILFTGGK